MSRSNAQWREKPITDAQIRVMDANGIDWDERMTRGEASDAITEHEETAGHPFSEEALQ